jgi:hypothetical protein
MSPDEVRGGAQSSTNPHQLVSARDLTLSDVRSAIARLSLSDVRWRNRQWQAAFYCAIPAD